MVAEVKPQRVKGYDPSRDEDGASPEAAVRMGSTPLTSAGLEHQPLTPGLALASCKQLGLIAPLGPSTTSTTTSNIAILGSTSWELANPSIFVERLLFLDGEHHYSKCYL
ncbi:hypothetical protein AOLI_G00280220 [Acnodon oligacanthus]